MCWKLFILWEGQKEKFLKYINANIVHIRDKGSGIFDHRIMTERLLLNFFVKSVVQQTVSDMEVRAKVCLSGVTFRSIILWYHVMLQFDLPYTVKGCLEYNEVRFLFLFFEGSLLVSFLLPSLGMLLHLSCSALDQLIIERNQDMLQAPLL